MYDSQVTALSFYGDAHNAWRILIGTTAATRMIFKHSVEKVSGLIASLNSP